MRLPRKTAPASARRDYGVYVVTRLAVAGQDGSAVMETTQDVKKAQRHLEDVEEAVPMALARRDADDDALDELAQTVRLGLASRSITATKEEPYKTVFYKGLAYYTAAPIRENAKRYRDLAERLSTTLPAGHALLALVPQIHAAAAAFEASAAAVDEARNKVGLARTQLEVAEDAWARTLEKTYGALISEYGKAKAERFFPSLGKRDEVTSDDDAPPVSPPPA